MCLRESDLVGFDLMDTIVHPPGASSIQQWLKWVSKYYKLSKFQENLFLIGFPYASFVDKVEDFEYLKKILLISKNDDFLKEKNGKKYEISCLYANFFMENIIFPEDNWVLLLKLKEYGKKIILISNLYPIYKGIIKKKSLDILIDEIYLSCECGFVKPSKKIFSTVFDNNKLCSFVGDNYLSDIFPLRDSYIKPYFYTQSKLIYFVKNNGIANLIEQEMKSTFRINNTAFKHLNKAGLIDSNKQFYIDKKYLVNNDGKIILKSLEKVYLTKNLQDLL